MRPAVSSTESPVRGRAADRLGTTLLAVARPMLPTLPPLSDDDRTHVEADLMEHLRAQILAMPTHLRIPFTIALFAFEALPVLSYLRPFHRVSRETQTRIISSWNRSPIPQFRDLIKLVRSCALLAYLDHPIVRRHLADVSPAGEPGVHDSDGESGGA